jgi:hypothetical protein
VFFCSLGFADNLSQISTGDNSNNFSNITGNISINYNVSANKKPSEEDARNIIEKMSNEKIKDLVGFKWLNINSDRYNVLFAAYSLASYEFGSDSPKAFSDLFIVDNDNVMRVYHAPALEYAELQNIAIGQYDGKKYLFMYAMLGSGGYLEGDMYEIDQLQQLHKVYSLSDEEGSFSGSSVASINNNLIINQPGKTLILVKNVNKFSLENYRGDIKYPDLGESKHILNIKSCFNKEVYFDNKEIDRSYLTYDGDRIVASIKMGEDILVVLNDKIYRILSSSDKFEYIDGVYTNLRSIGTGDTALFIDCDADSKNAFNVNFKIE